MFKDLSTDNVNQFFRVIFGRGIIVKISFAIILVFIFAALLAPILTPYTPYEQDLTLLFAKPSGEHLLGTDNIGRDLLTRLLYGARISLTTSLLASIWGGLIGITLGLIAGYFEGFILHGYAGC